MASPKPRPAALKLMEGRSRGRDSGGRKVKAAPAFMRLPPSPPAWLSDAARAEWDRVLPELTRLDLIKELDANALAAYCETSVLYAMAVQDVHANGLTVVNHGKDGAEWTTTNPSVGTMVKLGSQLRAWCAEFGLTPSAETKVVKAEVDDADEEGNPFARSNSAQALA